MEELTVPLLALRDIVVYPNMVIPLFIGRGHSILALENASHSDRKEILLVSQLESNIENPTKEDLYSVGVLARVLQLLKLPDGTIKVLVEGICRVKILEYTKIDPFFEVIILTVESSLLEDQNKEALIRSVLVQFEQFIKLSNKLSPELLTSLSTIDNADRLIDTIAAQLPINISEKQQILEQFDLKKRINNLMVILEREIEFLYVQLEIRGEVKDSIDKNQKEYYLNEQMKAVRKQLDNLNSNKSVLSEVDILENKIKKANMPKDAKEKANNELNKLKISMSGPESQQIMSYLDWMIKAPWKKSIFNKVGLSMAQEILEQEHYGLEKVKERIIEYLAVQERVKKVKGSVLCLVGPPGVGKTSLGKSIAKAMGRKFVRFSLGGLRDEAEIKGHRKTYIGALPGKIIQNLSKIGVNNPVFLLDEIDKMAMDHRGDPASALLEVLDPEQNNKFTDHYLDVDFDLSNVVFIATSNSLNIPAPLLDRMEIIKIAGYTEDEKIKIAEKYLLPKQKILTGLKDQELCLSKIVMQEIIRYYTRESGVRSLEREISKICRKVVKNILLNTNNKNQINLEEYLGIKKYRFGVAKEQHEIGQVTGLAWTEVGGEILTIEAVVTQGKGNILKTGKLGDVMQESIQAAVTVVRSMAYNLNIDPNFYEKSDIHIHVPEGATPKDGPSAGIAMCVALVSVLTNIPVKKEIAMTGEITLRGNVLPIGGLKEKLLAAKRAGITEVIIPEDNVRELKEIPENVYKELDIYPVVNINDVLNLSLTKTIKGINKEKNKDAEQLIIKNKLDFKTEIHSKH